MKRDIVVIVARQLKEAQDEHAKALQIVERIQVTLNRKIALLVKADERLVDIEEIHNNLPD